MSTRPQVVETKPASGLPVRDGQPAVPHLRGLLLGAAAQLTDHGRNNRIERVMTAKVERLNRTHRTRRTSTNWPTATNLTAEYM